MTGVSGERTHSKISIISAPNVEAGPSDGKVLMAINFGMVITKKLHMQLPF